MTPDELTITTFAAQLNTKFRVRAGDERHVEVELIEVTDRKSSPTLERFSIIFRGPAEHFIPQGTYTFEHGQLGALELFIVPVGQDRDGFYYEAIFNRLR